MTYFDKDKNLGKKRNKLLMDFDMLASENPKASNRSIFYFMVIIIGFIIAYVASFYI